MSTPPLISRPDDITVEWLSNIFQQAGINGTVSGFTAESIGTGQVGENVRFELTGTGDIPMTVVGKFPSTDPVSRQTGIDTSNYIREVHFYEHLQSRVSIQTPVVFFTGADNETHDFVIMMEELPREEWKD